MGERPAGHGRYEAVAVTDEETLTRFASTATRFGYDGVVLRRAVSGRDGQGDGSSIVRGATVEASDRSRAGTEIARMRDEATVLFASARDDDVRHFLAGQERLDVLRMPGTERNPVSHTTVTRAKQHGVFIEVDLGRILRQTGTLRSRSIGATRRIARFIDHFDCPYVVSAAPHSPLELRAPRELIAIGETIGLDAGFVERGIEAWGTIVTRTRRIHDDRFIEPGVEIARDEGDGG